jgi:3-isopropylmalate/(R)-2-methylmalate dehydratase small subunit
MQFKGKVFIFGNDVNTDEIIPARYLNTSDPKVLGQYCMEDIRPGFGKSVAKGSIIVAGNNFGCGSSREHAPIAIKNAGISCVIANSFARIFFRNCINIGLPIIESKETVQSVSEGDVISVDLKTGHITLASGKSIKITPFPVFMQRIVEQGGWIPYLRAQYKF